MKRPPAPAYRGFTLLELIIVIGIIGLMMGVGITGLTGLSSTRLRVQTNKLSSALRYSYNRAVAHGLYLRMVLDIDADAYWVEASEEPVFLPKEKRKGGDEAEEEEEKGKEEKDKDGAPITKRQRFQQDGVIPRVKMDKGVGIQGVLTSGQEDVFESGKAYIHFFPNGFVEPAIIYTTDGEEGYYTLQISPLTGRVKSRYGKVDPGRDFGQPDRVEDEGR
ncbi:prepilin-type N-terminal cleavage/methylation domain-containing protein [Myxococcota bacterium]|nr:prepilin-type N-terminal cleavage/methylation domain-containing protein [Myxococcota bacterium]MBU1429459.1 prepilin-type N-terminal cleavage/methylation domain-containing protein [Myxococcota bacterium]MBU1897478.1 prepilin-type N-terminal cleavage/methylation domain-containing protein [Myxococcota bacterium]